MITTRAMPALLPAHHRRVASAAAIKNDFADPLPGTPPRRGQDHQERTHPQGTAQTRRLKNKLRCRRIIYVLLLCP